MIYINDDIEGFDLASAFEEVSVQRRTYALRYLRERDRRLSVAAYLLLCKGLREEFGIVEKPDFGFGVHGKPFLIGHPDIHFNLSHCDGVCACVISSHPVGIDVERILLYEDDVIRRTMNKTEQERIQRSEKPETAFIRLWTMKESLLKLTGQGLCVDLSSLLNNADRYCFTTDERDGYMLTVCEEKDERNRMLHLQENLAIKISNN